MSEPLTDYERKVLRESAEDIVAHADEYCGKQVALITLAENRLRYEATLVKQDNKIAALVKACERFRATLEYGGESGGDTFLYTSPQDLREFKVAIKDVGK